MSVKRSKGHLMINSSPRSGNFLEFLLAASGILIIGYFLFLRDQKHDYHQIYKVAVSSEKATWVEAALKVDLDAPYDNSALVALCESRVWIDGLVFKCAPLTGGVAVVRNAILNCVRYAIEAGATSFFVPEIDVAPSSKASHSKRTTPITVPFAHFFDTDFFTRTLSISCPRINLISHQNDLDNFSSTNPPIPFTPASIAPAFFEDTDSKVLNNEALANWSTLFLRYLNHTRPLSTLSSEPILIVLTPPPIFQFPTSHDTAEFIATFGQLIRPAPNIRHLASTVLYALDKTYNLGLPPDSPGIQADKFYGAHLPLHDETGKMFSGWTQYSVQNKHYIASCMQNSLPVIYVASGNPSEVKNFSDLALDHSISVATKTNLLSREGFEKELQEVEELSSGQQELVDYEVLLRASLFGGAYTSPFSWNVAFRRRVVMSNGSWLPLRPGDANETHSIAEMHAKETGGGNGDEQSFRDEVSVVFGERATIGVRRFERSMWP